jgi:hypothetical protein
MRRRGAARAAAVVLMVAVTACSGGDDASPETTESPFGPTACPAAEPPLRVDQIDEAIAAVEAELGGPQEYFEINATSLLVNLFVADVETRTVTPYVYVGGELSSQEPLDGAQGFTFFAEAVAIDGQRVLSCIARDLPESTLEVFFVEGADGGVRFSALTSNELGGQLTVEVNGQGLVLAVETV